MLFIYVFQQTGPKSLHTICLYSNPTELAASLDRHQYDVDAQDQDGCCPIHFAAFRLAVAMVEVLLGAGADVHGLDTVSSMEIQEAHSSAKSSQGGCVFQDGETPLAI